MKIATIEDIELVTKHCLSFASTIKQSSIVDNDKIIELIKTFLTSPPEEKIILLHGEAGMLVAFTQPFLLGTSLIASELAWWVDPAHRKSNVGRELVEAFEFWAKKLNCKYTVMSCYADNDVGRFYENQGYTLHEKGFIKEI